MILFDFFSLKRVYRFRLQYSFTSLTQMQKQVKYANIFEIFPDESNIKNIYGKLSRTATYLESKPWHKNFNREKTWSYVNLGLFILQILDFRLEFTFPIQTHHYHGWPCCSFSLGILGCSTHSESFNFILRCNFQLLPNHFFYLNLFFYWINLFIET